MPPAAARSTTRGRSTIPKHVRGVYHGSAQLDRTLGRGGAMIVTQDRHILIELNTVEIDTLRRLLETVGDWNHIREKEGGKTLVPELERLRMDLLFQLPAS